MSGIKRFDHVSYGMVSDTNGEYIFHSDYEEEVARLRAEVEALQEAFHCRTIDWNEACFAREGWALKAKEACAEAASLRVDAERYRYIRRCTSADAADLVQDWSESELDAEIDAAMGEGK